MRWFYTIFFAINACILLLGQSNMTTITILGRSKSTVYSSGYAFTLKFLDESNKCDANYPMSGDEKYKHLKEFIEAGNYKLIEFTRNEAKTNTKDAFFYDIVLSNIDDVNKLKQNCQNLGISITSKSYYFEGNGFEEEYDRALNAYNDAREKAEMYAKNLGMRVKDVYSIDDYTSYLESNLNNKNTYNDKQNALYNMGHSSYSSFSQFSKSWFSNERDSQYTLKVEFILE